MTERLNAYPELERELCFHPLGVDRPGVLTRGHIDSYNENGFLSPLSVFSDSEISSIRDYFDALLPRALAAGWSSYEMINWHKHCQGVYDIVTDGRVLDIVQDLLGESVILRHSHFFAKLPGDGKRVSWHQDASYWPLSRSRVVTVWLAVDDVDRDNAAMQVIPGSHLKAQLPFQDSKPDERNVLNQTVVAVEQYGDPAVVISLKAGQISLHSDWTLHASDINRSRRRRCGLAMRFLSSDVKAYRGWNAHSVICRGTDPSGHWANHPRPVGEYVPSNDQPGAKMDALVETR